MAKWKRRVKYYILNGAPPEVTYLYYFKRVIYSNPGASWSKYTELFQFNSDPSIIEELYVSDVIFGGGREYSFCFRTVGTTTYHYTRWLDSTLEEDADKILGTYTIGSGEYSASHEYYTNFDITDDNTGLLVPKNYDNWKVGKDKYFNSTWPEGNLKYYENGWK